MDPDPEAGPMVVSPPNKVRRVTVNRGEFDRQVDHANDSVRQNGDNASQSKIMPMSVDFAAFGVKPPPRPTLNRYTYLFKITVIIDRLCKTGDWVMITI